MNKKVSKLTINVSFKHEIVNFDGQTRTETGKYDIEMEASSIRTITEEAVKGALDGLAENLATKLIGEFYPGAKTEEEAEELFEQVV